MSVNATGLVGFKVTSTPFEPHRVALTGHCYRMLGSLAEADDAVQETMLRAWQNFARFEGRSSLRTWLYRIATNVCLDALSQRAQRTRPTEHGPVGTTEDELVSQPRTHWIEPVPDALAVPSDEDPAAQLMLRQSVRLAFVTAVQHLPPRQRATLLLSEVLGWPVAEIAETIESTVPAVNSMLQRARATLATSALLEAPAQAPLSDAQHTLVQRFVDAFERYDIDALVALLREDATMCMPPYTLWLQGHSAVHRWLTGRGVGCKGSRLLPAAANGAPSFAQYRPDPAKGGYSPWALVVLELEATQVRSMTYFLDTETLFPRFGLPGFLPR